MAMELPTVDTAKSFWSRPVLMRVFTGLFVSVYPIEIIEDKLTEMKKRRDKMNAQISEVSGQPRLSRLSTIISTSCSLPATPNSQ